MGTGQQFSLRWNNYLRHITCAFDSLRSDEDLVDVTLSCEGKRIRAHKMLLSACSTYFRDLFKVSEKWQQASWKWSADLHIILCTVAFHVIHSESFCYLLSGVPFVRNENFVCVCSRFSLPHTLECITKGWSVNLLVRVAVHTRPTQILGTRSPWHLIPSWWWLEFSSVSE